VKFPHLQLTSRTGAIAAIAAVVVGLGGWAFADGSVPLISSSAPDSTTTTTAAGTLAVNAGGSGGDNVAVASNTKDGKTVVAISLKIVQTASSNVDPANVAVAAASCTDCETVAIALEGVLVAGDPTTFDPANVALAINSDCTNCQTLATAYQDVVQNDTRVRITGAGRKEIADIRQDLDSLRKSGLDIVAIQKRVNDDAGRFLAVLRNDVVPIGPGAKAADASTTTTAPAPAGTAATPSTTVPASTTTTTSPPPATTTPSSTTTTTPVP
jgi:putative peptide zinc metalloprotease protein